MDTSKVCVIKVGNRFFPHIGHKRQIMTAWHLAGAEFYMHSALARKMAEAISLSRKECVKVVEVQVVKEK